MFGCYWYATKTQLWHNFKRSRKGVLFLRLTAHWLTWACWTAEFWACMQRTCSQVCFYSTCPLSSAPFLSASLFPSFLLLCPSVWAFQFISPHYTHTHRATWQSCWTVQGSVLLQPSLAAGHTTWGGAFIFLRGASDRNEIVLWGVWWDPLSWNRVLGEGRALRSLQAPSNPLPYNGPDYISVKVCKIIQQHLVSS